MSDADSHDGNGAGPSGHAAATGDATGVADARQVFMVQSHLQPPRPFSFRSEDWIKWRNRWSRYVMGSGLSTQSDEYKINTFIYTMGEKAEDILLALKLTPQQSACYDDVVRAYDEHFGVRTNVVLERQRFLRRKQGPDESVDDFIADLHRLAENCRLGDLHDEFIRDVLIAGIRDTKLSESLTLNCNLDLTTAVHKVRQKEELHRQQRAARDSQGKSSVSGDVSFVNKARGGGQHQTRRSGAVPKHRQSKSTGQSSSSAEHKTGAKRAATCRNCGRSPQHPFRDCPAKGTKCTNCGKSGHWACVCSSVKTVAQEECAGSAEELFLGCVQLDAAGHSPVAQEGGQTASASGVFAVGTASRRRPPWLTEVVVNGRTIKFQVDSGADVTVISRRTYEAFLANVELRKTTHRLRGPGRRPLSVVGMVVAPVRWRGKITDTEIYVIEEDANNLLGRPAIEDLRMLKWDAVVATTIADEEGAVDIWQSKFPTVFKGLGCINYSRPYVIVTQPGAKPHAVTAPRRVSVQLREKVRTELQRMVKMGVITPVDEATEWCAPMVVVLKTSGSVRICVDYTELNRSVRRERYMMPSVDEMLALLGDARWFTKLDANHGYHQLALDEDSKKLTTFITPFGRFCYNRLPMGLSSASEHFQKRISEILAGLEGVIHLADDILVHGATREEHDQRLCAAMTRLSEHKVTLNKAKCDFATQRTKFLGYVIDAEKGVQPDPEKVEAIVNMPRPTCPADVSRFLGMVNYQLKFLNHLSTLTQPLRDLRKEENEFVWTDVHESAFQEVKERLSSAPALAFFDPKKRTRVSADSSSYGLGAVLEQFHQTWEYDGVTYRDEWRPVYYASRSLTETERRYAQIEKEALALTWACEKFQMFVIGAPDLILRTDHKPLVSLLGLKPLSELTPRLQRMRMRLMRFAYTIEHVPGKSLLCPDTLSRAPQPDVTPVRETDVLTDEEVEFMATAIIAELPVADPVLRRIQEAQQGDALTQRVLQHVQHGWPHSRDVDADLLPFHHERGSLTVINGLLVWDSRIYIPGPQRANILALIHQGHLGETKCLGRARASVWWPGVSADVRRICSSCEVCALHRPQPVEPLIPAEVPERPWQRVAADLGQRGSQHYLVVVDCYSRYPEVAKLGSLTAAATIGKLRDIFARHGVPEEFRSDNGPQFDSAEFRTFADELGFRVVTMSPGHSQANGQAEAAVKVVKNILKKAADPYGGLLAYRTAPLESGYSPGELLMGRRLRTTVPCVSTSLLPRQVDAHHHRAAVSERKMRSKANFDRRHRAKELRPLVSGELVYVRDKRSYAVVVRRRPEPRSYEVLCDNEGVLRRNRAFLVPVSRKAGDHDEGDDLDNEDIPGPEPQPQAQPAPEVQANPVPDPAPRPADQPPTRRSERATRGKAPERLITVCATYSP